MPLGQLYTSKVFHTVLFGGAGIWEKLMVLVPSSTEFFPSSLSGVLLRSFTWRDGNGLGYFWTTARGLLCCDYPEDVHLESTSEGSVFYISTSCTICLRWMGRGRCSRGCGKAKQKARNLQASLFIEPFSGFYNHQWFGGPSQDRWGISSRSRRLHWSSCPISARDSSGRMDSHAKTAEIGFEFRYVSFPRTCLFGAVETFHVHNRLRHLLQFTAWDLWANHAKGPTATDQILDLLSFFKEGGINLSSPSPVQCQCTRQLLLWVE